MRKIIFLILIFSLFVIINAEKIDINNASPDAIDSLLIPDEVITGIKDYIESHGEIKSIYELRSIEGVDSEIFQILKDKIAIYPSKEKEDVSVYLIRLQERLASEESPTQGAIELWEDLLVNRMNINKVSVNDLLKIEGVNITDAVAIVKSRNKFGKFSYENQIKRSYGLTYYAWTKLRNYITLSDNDNGFDFSGYLRTNMKYTNDDTYGYTSISALRYSLLSAIHDLEVSAPDSTNTRDKLLEAGMTSADIDKIKNRMEDEYNELAARELDGDIVNKLKMRSKYANIGLLVSKYSGIEYYDYSLLDNLKDINADAFDGFITEASKYKYKFYTNVKSIPYIDNLIVGNYRISLGQGLVMDNTDEYRARKLNVINGLYGDLTESYANKFTGIALNGKASRLEYLLFGSNETRNAIMNNDSTVNILLLTETNMPSFENKVNEKTYGGNINIDLGGIINLPLATQIGFSGYQSIYDKSFNNDTLFIDIPFDKDNLNTPVYTQLYDDSIRTVLGMTFRTNIKNSAIECEIAKQDNTYAYIIMHDIRYNNFYLKTIFRHYDVGFDNPYARPLSEQSRFDDTVLEKEYRLIDPLFLYLTDDPRPKPEEGLYLETRYRLSKNLTITKAYIDIWRTLDYNLFNYRFQGEIEFRPVFPIRLRLKQKIQEKNIYKSIVSTHSITNETTFRVFSILTNSDYLNFEMRYGRVNLTPSLKYGENYIIDGSYVNASFEHKLTNYFSFLSGFATWKTNGMSQWIFEDTGIDFLYGDGYKFYLTVIDIVSDNLTIRAKASFKNQDLYHTGIYSPDNEYKYYDSDYMNIRDFVDYNNIFNLSIRMDIRW